MVVTFPAAEVQIEFLDPADDGEDGGAYVPYREFGSTL